jgi:Mrp family chromosome partitioning ATPase/capsular polysaccharide biosynthesis protein
LNSQATINPDVHFLEQLFAVARRRWLTVLFFALLGLAAGYVHALNQVPVFATSATVMVRSGPAADPLRQGIETSTPEEEGQFLSQLELARSATVARMVADKLGLIDDAAFASAGSSRIERLLARVIGGNDDKVAPLNIDAIVSRLQAGVKVLRIGRTYVAAISYTHPDREVARKVAQAFAESFRQKIAQDGDLANSRLRAVLQGEIDRTVGPEKDILKSRLRDLMVARALPGMDVLVMSDARLPEAPIAPRSSFLAIVGLILGAVVGCAVAGFRELTDRGMRDGDALARLTGVRFLGYVPRRAPKTGAGVTIGNGQPVPDAARRAVTEPHSAFGETVRAMGVVAISSAVEGRGRVTGLTSVLPGDATMVLAVNLATHLASLGRSVILIDGDARDAALSRWLAASAEEGLVEALLQDKPLDECVVYDPKTNLSVLPMVSGGNRMVEPLALFASARTEAFFARLRGQYQHVIIDFPSIARAVDARAASPHVDGFLLTVPWGKATPQLVMDVLAAETEVRAKLVGTVMTRAHLGQLPLYAAAGSRAAFQKKIVRG